MGHMQVAIKFYLKNCGLPRKRIPFDAMVRTVNTLSDPGYRSLQLLSLKITLANLPCRLVYKF